jgi:hypothetical protein
MKPSARMLLALPIVVALSGLTPISSAEAASWLVEVG